MSRFRPELLEKIAGKIAEVTGSDPVPLDELGAILEKCFEAYEIERKFGRDSMSTSAEISRGAGIVADHLQGVLELIVDYPDVGAWIGVHMSGGGEVSVGEAYMAFGEPLTKCLEAARATEEKFAQGGPLTVVYGDRAERPHMRRTRTDARDRVLIPALVRVLQISGMEFWTEIDGRDSPDADALDGACEIIAELLRSQGIPTPDPGDTKSRGEQHQGRLRRAIKEAAARLDK